MPTIELLTQETIDKIAAGEVIERPSSVVKELVENAIDAKATAITVEIKDGGISLIRITDNGCGIQNDQVPLAFMRHSTSKIRSVEDLMSISSLGFRGEALSSISAVSRVELITKTYDALTGTRYVIEGSKEIENEEVGAPDGTTFLVKDLFFNTPARRKFLKSAQTEAGYISDIVERLALSHPEISFKFINNNQTKLHTSGNGNRKDLIYHIYGREIAHSLIEVDVKSEHFEVSGFIGKPVITRGNRNYENYFINGRYIKSTMLAKAIEEAYKSFLMQHQYPFTVLYFKFTSNILDVNVHPTKMELRFEHENEIYSALCEAIHLALSQKELIPEVPIEEKKEQKVSYEYKTSIPEPFERRRLNDIRASVAKDSPYEIKYPKYSKRLDSDNVHTKRLKETSVSYEANINHEKNSNYEPITLESISSEFLTEDAKKKHRIIGQLFKTYWLIEFEDKLYIIDQHAAHEKVLFERTMKRLKDKDFTSQTINPPIVLSLDAKETEMLETYMEEINKLGYVVEHFGGKEYMIRAVPDNIFHLNMKDLFIEMLDDFTNISGKATPEIVLEKVASMSCKAAIKGNQKISTMEMESLIDELLTLDNPFHCPHGRPTIISMTKFEIEKKFKRIV